MTDERIKKELKPCPFCGERSWFSIETVGAPDYVSAEPPVCVVICNHCHSWGPQAPTKPQAIKAWNTRAAERLAKIEALAPVLLMMDKLRFFSVADYKDAKDRIETMIAELKESGEPVAPIVDTLKLPRDCTTCRHDGKQMIFPGYCTSCTPGGDESLYRHWEPKEQIE